MEKVSQELVESYKIIELEIEDRNSNLKLQQKNLAKAEERLTKSEASLEAAESAQKSSALVTVHDVENARTIAKNAKCKVDDFSQVINNIGLAIRNSQNIIHDLVKKKNTVSKKIWRDYAGTLSTKVHSSIKEDIDRLWVALLTANPDMIPLNQYTMANEFSFMFRPAPDKISLLRHEIFNEILNGNSGGTTPPKHVAPSNKYTSPLSDAP